MARHRWVQINGKLVPVGENFIQEGQEPPKYHILGDKNYEGMASPIDGSDISSRTKHRTYMKDNNLAITDDFKGQWQKQREQAVAGVDPTRKQSLVDAVNKHYRR